jgi:hypothetical protein
MKRFIVGLAVGACLTSTSAASASPQPDGWHHHRVHMLPSCHIRGIKGPAYVVGLDAHGRVVCTQVVRGH